MLKSLKEISRNKLIFYVFMIIIFVTFVIYINRNSDEKTTDNRIDLNSEVSIEQTFKNNGTSKFGGISILFGTINNNVDGEITVELLKQQKQIAEWKVNADELEGGKYFDFKLDKEESAAKTDYTIKISAKNIPQDYIAVFSSSKEGEVGLAVNGNEQSHQVLCYKILGEDSKNILFIPVILLGILLIISLCVLFQYNNISIEKKFIILYIAVGVIFHFIVPAFKVPDEPQHFCRAFEIANGHLLSELNEEGIGGRELPINIIPIENAPTVRISDMPKYRDISLSEEVVFTNFSNLSLYSPTSYLPQALGIRLASFFTDNILAIFYMGRIMNWIFILVLTYYALKYIPFGKTLMMIICLLPMNLQEIVSLSPDGMVTACVFAFFSFIMYMRYTYSEKMKNIHYVIMYVFAILLALYKIVYVPLCLLLFLIPKERFKSNKTYRKHCVILGGLIVVFCFGWLAIASRYLIEFNPGVDSAEQVKYILGHPFNYLLTLFGTIVENFHEYLVTMIGSKLGWLNISINNVIIDVFLLILFVFSYPYGKVMEWNGKKKDIKAKSFMLVSSLLVILLVFTSLYVQWTMAQGNRIMGVQGRYFIPILLPLLLGIHRKNYIGISEDKNREEYIVGVSFILELCVCVILLYNNY